MQAAWKHWTLAIGLSLTATLWLGGCAKSETGEVAQAEPEEAGHDHEHGEHGHDHDHEGHDAHAHDDAKVKEALAQLTPDEMKLAEAQEMHCIVAGEVLGSMGKPVLVQDVGGQDYLICCAGCEEELRKDPAKYAEKLASMKKEAPHDEPATEAAPAAEAEPKS